MEWTTSETPLWTSRDIARATGVSGQRVNILIKRGTLTPQFRTLRGYPLFTAEYIEWAKVNVPWLKNRMSDHALR